MYYSQKCLDKLLQLTLEQKSPVYLFDMSIGQYEYLQVNYITQLITNAWANISAQRHKGFLKYFRGFIRRYRVIYNEGNDLYEPHLILLAVTDEKALSGLSIDELEKRWRMQWLNKLKINPQNGQSELNATAKELCNTTEIYNTIENLCCNLAPQNKKLSQLLEITNYRQFSLNGIYSKKCNRNKERKNASI